MAYLSQDELSIIGFKSLGINVKISTRAIIYNPEAIEIGDNTRIDDLCILSGKIKIGSYVHIGPMCLIAGGGPGIFIGDFSGVSYGSKIFSQSDDYSGASLTSPLIPKKYKNEMHEPVYLGKHVIVGASCVIMPGVNIAMGCAIGAMSLVNKNTDPWGIYIGQPARRIKDRKQDMLMLEKSFLKEAEDYTI